MEIIHDDIWKQCLTDAMKMYRVGEANDKCFKLANATWIMKMKYKEASKRKDTHKVLIIDKPPEVKTEHRVPVKKLCSAITMSGKPCSFKAVCDGFCKKHNVTGIMNLGSKVNLNKIKIED